MGPPPPPRPPHHPGAARPPPPAIPVVSLLPFTDPGADGPSRLAAARALVAACHGSGFVQITDHGVPDRLLTEAFAQSRRFFELPAEAKALAPHPPGWAVHRGYSRPGLEKVSSAPAGVSVAAAAAEDEDGDREERTRALRAVPDLKESYDIGSDDNADQPNVWPPLPLLPGWRTFMTGLGEELWACALRVLRALALGLGLPAGEAALLSPFSGRHNQLRLLHYPAVPAADLEQGRVARMPAHSDWSVLTLLFQDACGGLQIRPPGAADSGSGAGAEKWLDVEPAEDALVMNVGDLLMRWSNDYLKSTVHRVTLPPQRDRAGAGPDRLTPERWSIAYFVTTDPDVSIAPLEGVAGDGSPSKYEPITQREYAAMRARMLLHY